MAIDRKTALERLQSQVKSGRPIIGAGAGTGISAKFTLAGGVDLIIITTQVVTEWLAEALWQVY